MSKEETKYTKEQIEMFKAQCCICLVADQLKDCKNCLFNVGLEDRAKKLAELRKK